MPNGDDKKPQKSPEVSGDKFSENYFERVNQEYEKAVETGEVLINKNVIAEISKRNEKKLLEKVVDAIKAPDEAIEWLKINIFHALAGTWLGEIFGAKKYLDSLKEKVMGKVKKKLEREGKTSESGKDKIEESPYVTAPLREVFPEFANEVKGLLLEAKQIGVQYKVLLGLLAAIGLVKYWREVLGAGRAGKDAILSLAKLPFKAIKRFPVQSALVLFAVLMNLDKVDDIGDIEVPKDGQNLKEYFAWKLSKGKEFIDEHELPFPEGLDVIESVMKGKEKLKDFIESPDVFLKSLYEGAKEAMRKNPEKVVRGKNILCFESFLVDLEKMALRADKEQETKIEAYYDFVKGLVEKMKKGENLSPQLFDKDNKEGIVAKGRDIGLLFQVDDGKIQFYEVNGPHVIEGPAYLCVDPSLSLDKAYEVAMRLWPRNTGNVLGIAADTAATYAGIYLDEFLKNKDALARIQNTLTEDLEAGADLIWMGTELYVYSKLKKYYLGPAELLWDVIAPIFVPGKDFSAINIGVDTGEGVMAIAVVSGTKHIGSALVRLRLGELLHIKDFSKKVLWESTTYQFSNLKRLKDPFTALRLWREGRLIELLDTHKYHLSSNFWEVVRRYQSVWGKYLKPTGGKPVRTIGELRGNQASLCEAMDYLSQANSPLNANPPEDLLKKSGVALDQAGESVLKPGQSFDNVKTAMDNVKQVLEKNQDLIDLHKENRVLEKARTALEKKNHEKARKILEHLGLRGREILASAPIDSDEMIKVVNRRILANNDEIVRLSTPGVKELRETPERKYRKIQAEFDEEFADMMATHDGIKREYLDEMKNAGKKLDDPEVQKNLKDMDALFEHDKAKHQDRRKAAGIELASEPRFKISPERSFRIREMIKTKAKSGLKTGGKGIGAVLLGIALVYGLDKTIRWLKGESDEFFDPRKMYEGEKEEEKKKREEKEKSMKEAPKVQEKTMGDIQDFSREIREEYAFFHEQMQYEKVNEIPEIGIQALVNSTTKKHVEVMERLKKFLYERRHAIAAYYEKFPLEQNIQYPLTLYATIGYDKEKKKPWMTHATEDDFKKSAYELIDAEIYWKGQTPTMGEEVTDSLVYCAPIAGTLSDGWDGVKNLRRGQWVEGAKSSGWFLFGTVSDILTFTGVGTVPGLAMRAGRGAVLVGRIAKASERVLKVTKLSKLAPNAGKIALLEFGTGLGRPIVAAFAPKQNGKFSIAE